MFQLDDRGGRNKVDRLWTVVMGPVLLMMASEYLKAKNGGDPYVGHGGNGTR